MLSPQANNEKTLNPYQQSLKENSIKNEGKIRLNYLHKLKDKNKTSRFNEDL